MVLARIGFARRSYNHRTGRQEPKCNHSPSAKLRGLTRELRMVMSTVADRRSTLNLKTSPVTEKTYLFRVPY